MSQHPEFDHFLAFAARVHPALQGEASLAEDESIVAGTDSTSVLDALYRFWQKSCPEGGQPYWSIRCWTMLVWQPVYLAVIGVHGVGALPSLTAIKQKLRQGIVAGFELPASPLRGAPREALIDLAGQELRLLADALLAQLTSLTRIRRVSAMRLVADALLAALVRLGQLKPDLGNEEILALSRRWLAVLDLAGQSDLMPITLSSGREQLALNRKGCCMDYRRAGGGLCASCPKLKMPARLERLRADYDALEDSLEIRDLLERDSPERAGSHV
jgi:siderophore ferric iron reductase